MPPAVLADSDDDEEIVVPEADRRSQSRRSQSSGISGGGKTINALDGTDERSTGSTDRLMQQIQSAERGLFAHSAPPATTAPSGSPGVKATKRRHTAAFASEPVNLTPEQTLKRAKTLETYNAKDRANVPADDSSGQPQHTPVVSPSQFVHFSEHSGVNSSVALPSGSIQTDFVNHEPTVMFRDSTCSTVEDNSSAQQRLYAQALDNRKAKNTSAIKHDFPPEAQQSSSLLWTASEHMHSSRTNVEKEAPKCVDDPENKADEMDDSRGDKNGSSAEQRDYIANDNDLSQLDTRSVEARAKPHASPAVEIPRRRKSVNSVGSPMSKSTPSTAKGRKRKGQDDAVDELNSEYAAIGLPKEQYKPRPSRRRVTQIVEEPIDLSMRPEKAAKIKRTKTTQLTEDAAPFDFSAPTKRSQTPSSISVGNQAFEDNLQTTSKEYPQEQDREHENGTSRAQQASLQPPAKQELVDKIFVAPAKPTPKTKLSSKVKRAQTTIFEDHVEFVGSRRSPNLSQQQAERKSALQDVSNEATGTSKRKRKTAVTEDDEEEDELTKYTVEIEKEPPPPKKRGRGRPPKAERENPPKAPEKVLEDSEDDDETLADTGEAAKSRGRPRKSELAAQAETKAGSDVRKLEEDMLKASTGHDATPKQPDAASAEQTRTPPSSATALAPDKTTPAPPLPPKSSPTTHSPIKSSSGVPLRVGLSKRHRIPSLLRLVKPAKR